MKDTEDLIRMAKGEDLYRDMREAVRKIADGCDRFKAQEPTPRRFNLPVCSSEVLFNHIVQVDTMFIYSLSVLHMLDTANHFCSAAFLKSQSSRDRWKTLLSHWMQIYVGMPDYLAVDDGSGFKSTKIHQNVEGAGVTLREAPMETPGAIGTVERYHALFRYAYEKIGKEMGRDFADKECLVMVVFAINYKVGTEGICTMLLVFRVIPRPTRNTPLEMKMMRTDMIDTTEKDITKTQAQMRVSLGLIQVSGPKTVEKSRNLRSLTAGSPVLV